MAFNYYNGSPFGDYPDISALTAGVGPTFQTIQGTGKANDDIRNWLRETAYDPQTRNWGDYLTGQFQGNGDHTTRVQDANNGNLQFLGGATGGEQDAEQMGNWMHGLSNDFANGNLKGNDNYQYVFNDASRVNDGIIGRNYFDSAGKNTKNEVLNDPASIGKFTSGDLGMVLGGLGAIGGVYALPMLLGGGAAGAAGGTTFGVVDQGLVGAGLDGVSLGGGAGSGAFLGEGVSSGIPAWDSSLGGAGSWSSAGGLTPGAAGGLTPTPPPANPAVAAGGGSGTAFTLPGIGDVSWLDLGKVGLAGLGALSGAQGNQQSNSVTRELPEFMQGAVAGPNGLVAQGQWLMNQQMNQPGLLRPTKKKNARSNRGLL